MLSNETFSFLLVGFVTSIGTIELKLLIVA